MSAMHTTFFVLLFLTMLISCMHHVNGNPVIASGHESMEICIENCAQCKKMFGPWFEGPLCAKSCIKFKGKIIPECEDYSSILPFLNKL